MSVVGTIGRNAPLTVGNNPVSALALIAAPIITAAGLAKTLVPILRRPLPDDMAELRHCHEAIPAACEFKAIIGALTAALTVPARPEQLRALVVIMLDGIGRAPSQNAATYVGALAMACEHDAFEDDGDAIISVEVAAGAARRLMREAIFNPTPAEFRSACLDVRREVDHLHGQLRHCAMEALFLRLQAQRRLDMPFDAVEPGTWPTDQVDAMTELIERARAVLGDMGDDARRIMLALLHANGRDCAKAQAAFDDAVAKCGSDRRGYIESAIYSLTGIRVAPAPGFEPNLRREKPSTRCW
jgi:hypothetical protein